MGTGSSSGAALLMFFVIIQVILTIALLLGGMYLLYCFQRAAAGLDRLATVAELWLEGQNQPEPPTAPSMVSPVQAVPTVPVAASSEIKYDTHA